MVLRRFAVGGVGTGKIAEQAEIFQCYFLLVLLGRLAALSFASKTLSHPPFPYTDACVKVISIAHGPLVVCVCALPPTPPLCVGSALLPDSPLLVFVRSHGCSSTPTLDGHASTSILKESAHLGSSTAVQRSTLHVFLLRCSSARRYWEHCYTCYIYIYLLIYLACTSARLRMPSMATLSTDALHPWRVLTASLRAKVSLNLTLCGGQCFHWHRTPRETFVGVIGDGVFELREVQCSAKLKKREPHRVGSKLPVSALPKRQRDTSSLSSTSEAVMHRSDCLACCWIEYRRLWPLTDPVRLSGKAHPRPPSSPLRYTDASQAPNLWENDEAMLSHYLSLDVDLGQLWQEWTDSPEIRKHPLVEYLVGKHLRLRSSRSDHNQRVCEHDTAWISGCIPIRHVRQDLHSCLFSFLCSQNNNVTRITGMVYALSRAYGDHLCDIELVTGEVRAPRQSAASTRSKATKKKVRLDAAANGRETLSSSSLKPHISSTNAGGWFSLYSFPSLEQLAAATEETLRLLRFGYRSKYIVEAVRFLRTHLPPEELQDKRALKGQMHPSPQLIRQHRACYQNGFYSAVLGHHSYHHQHQRDMLLLLPGVGRKVADCVALFALNRTHIVPVDTHMAQVSVEYLATASTVTSAGRKRSRSGSLLREEEVCAPTNLLLEWKNQAEALKVKKGVTSSSLRAVKGNGGSATTSSRALRKTPVPPLYERHHNVIQDAFWKLFGNYAGWAHSILFYYRMRK
ncbi:8-oxoguanine DNA glycosylase, putative [Leishmania tarentolae]|uniref:DNA-(apurinic or apyrimidinic site) lyase n=1 Tax=Leishmania tarentolae TaxID=5689 RepID=A0A640KT25_LEITA|nr:8-oxoguanine DNA glycosylase, putative [Leishmania tarentolae]